ncbi:RagB/SusD family nutrient uptake outer membrane protein [Chryseobacterium sp. ISL-6]|uniref:RagB/SusD family nutrient uptake outer membrane protein n=1 Tax=Chryseobacterium sp. ISL-6 TaxID=2819143 RepID=UPI001BE5C0AE|nr:RagB/SusD family nutrient uptake outer membrane protein [Chryseobacterium sp. ISL-6]MBT2621818.1 RagB/SusD family nutrient uptake outer membrane protein [Chryseobacterium sp. ISL-6]
MKKIKVLLIILTGVIVSSCQGDFTEELPPITLPLDQAITNEKVLNTAVNGLYGYYQTNSDGSLNSYGALLPTLQELLGDNAFVAIVNSNRFSTTRDSNLTFYTRNNGDIATLWATLYKIIANANFVLGYEGKISDDLTTPGTPENLFGQAHAIRAMAYSTLVALYSDNFNGSNPDVGVPLPLEFKPGTNLPRASVKQVYDQIFSDLTKAKSLVGTTNGNKKLNSTAIDLLFSRYYLAIKNYGQANTYAQSVLDNSTSTLLPSSGVANYFSAAGETNPETIFQVDYNSLDLPGDNDGITATWSSTGRYKQNFATQTFFSKLGANDVRRGTWYRNTGYVQTLTDNPKPIDVMKYTTTDRDIVVLRKTEAVFNQLEALYYTNPVEALTKLNAWVKTYRDTDYVYAGTGTDLLKEILMQKNLEMFLEGFRYSDLKRNGISFKNPQTQVELTPAKVQFKAFPITQSELNTNTLIQQYPGY